MSEVVEREALQQPPRPWEITLLVIFGYIAGVFNLLTGVLVMIDREDSFLQQYSFNSEDQLLWFGILMSVLGLAQIFLAYKLGRGSQAVRIFYTVLAALNLGAAVWSMIALHSEQRASGVMGATVSLIVLWLLFNQKSETFFEET